jgi:hypothetical protein
MSMADPLALRAVVADDAGVADEGGSLIRYRPWPGGIK